MNKTKFNATVQVGHRVVIPSKVYQAHDWIQEGGTVEVIVKEISGGGE